MAAVGAAIKRQRYHLKPWPSARPSPAPASAPNAWPTRWRRPTRRLLAPLFDMRLIHLSLAGIELHSEAMDGERRISEHRQVWRFAPALGEPAAPA